MINRNEPFSFHRDDIHPEGGGSRRRTVMVASDCTTERSASAGERLLELSAAAAVWFGSLWRSARNRRTVAKLLEWDDRMLRDIGLTRGDVCAVMALPTGQDPSYRLIELSGERR